MLKNYIKLAFRSIWRHKGFSFLNIAGLAIGMEVLGSCMGSEVENRSVTSRYIRGLFVWKLS